MFTIEELKERILSSKNPDDILELLDISVDQLLDRFEDKIEERYEQLCEEFEDETPELRGESTSD